MTWFYVISMIVALSIPTLAWAYKANKRRQARKRLVALQKKYLVAIREKYFKKLLTHSERHDIGIDD